MDVTALSKLASLLSVVEAELPPDDTIIESTPFQIHDGESWLPVGHTVWRAWSGPRAIWGVPYHGPVYSLLSTDDSSPWDGPRACRCVTCQSHVSAASRPN